MRFLSLFLEKKKIVQKGKALAKILLSSCAIIIVLSGIALAADRDVIIGFHKDVGQTEKDMVKSHGGAEKKSFHLIPAISARLPEAEIEKMKKDPKIAYIEDDKIFEAADEYSSSWGVQHIGSQIVHAQGFDGTGVRIAILDTGIDYDHPDLDGNYKGGNNFVEYSDGIVRTDPFDDSYNSHGTHVAGIIAAENNGIGVVGVAPNADIYAIKVLDGGGFGPASWIISGIEWAIENNMTIVSMSIQGDDSQALHDAVDNAYNAGLLLIAAGGNYRTGTGPVKYPAAYDSVIAVTATDAADHNASFASIGSEIELAAPGVGIYSTIKGGYGFMDGTSMAAPHVTGVAALIISKGFGDFNGDGVINNTDVRAILQSTAKDLGATGRDSIYGYGLVDASMAVLGYSVYPASTDLSITKNDNVDVIAAGDGNTYKYTITVKNNGSLNASNVKLFDAWPAGFKRGIIATSQGICDTATSSTNFTCDLGTIVKGGRVTITAKYTVPSSTSPGNYTNKVQISSTTPDSNTANNIAEDKNIVKVVLTIKRKGGSPNNDAKKVFLSKGNYLVEISNVNLAKLDMTVLENGVVRKDLPSTFKFNKSNKASFEVYGKDVLEIVFIPYGDEDSKGIVTIRSLS
jgi:subtilisin